MVRSSVFVAVLSLAAAQGTEPFDSSRAWEHLRQMVAMGPRQSGSVALRQTRPYVAKQIAAAGLTVYGLTFLDSDYPVGGDDQATLVIVAGLTSGGVFSLTRRPHPQGGLLP